MHYERLGIEPAPRRRRLQTCERHASTIPRMTLVGGKGVFGILGSMTVATAVRIGRCRNGQTDNCSEAMQCPSKASATVWPSAEAGADSSDLEGDSLATQGTRGGRLADVYIIEDKYGSKLLESNNHAFVPAPRSAPAKGGGMGVAAGTDRLSVAARAARDLCDFGPTA